MRVQCFQDFDAFAASVRKVESRMMFRNPDRLTWSLTSVDVDPMAVQLGRLGSGNIAQGQLYENGYLLYLPLTPAVEYSVNGTTLERNSFAILEPGSEFCVSTKVAHDWITAFVPTPVLARAAASDGPSPRVDQATVRVTRTTRQVVRWFRAVVNDILTAAAASSRFETSPAAQGAAAELLNVVTSIMGRPQAVAPQPAGRARIPRQLVVRRCQELLEQSDGRRVNVRELAAAAHVSERTLRTVFHEYYGVGPVGYLHLSQLHDVHRALKAAESEAASVSDVLVENGVWEFGRFARRYRGLYGEPPSATLQAK
jgi:AraC family ethanolamine operon transcriptional activator